MHLDIFNLPIGFECRRDEILLAYGGQRYGGMATPIAHKIIFLFTGAQGEKYGYADHFHTDGLFWYTGEGQIGDMKLAGANRQLAQHQSLGKRVFIFETPAKAAARFMGEAVYTGHHMEERPDRNGDPRQAIVFELSVLSPLNIGDAGESEAPQDTHINSLSLSHLRKLALFAAARNAPPSVQRKTVQIRAEAVRRYALKRAQGKCECCLKPAPFNARTGPFLEVHHVYRRADGGPDHPGAVCALCPNCHREAHFGMQGAQLNQRLIHFLTVTEGSLNQVI